MNAVHDKKSEPRQIIQTETSVFFGLSKDKRKIQNKQQEHEFNVTRNLFGIYEIIMKSLCNQCR